MCLGCLDHLIFCSCIIDSFCETYDIFRNDPNNPLKEGIKEERFTNNNKKDGNFVNNIILSEYYRCMKSKNWINPNDWSKGKPTPYYTIVESSYIIIN